MVPDKGYRKEVTLRRIGSLALISIMMLGCATQPTRVVVHPVEDAQAVLHNPGMGWVLYENYPLDQGGSSTLVTLPKETFPEVDAVAVMFAWSDVERRDGVMDWSKVDHAYDWWKQRGKEIQLRMSSESLLYWSKANPPAGLGVPQWVLDQLPANAKQTRTSPDHIDYNVVDARDAVYRKYLSRFLSEVNRHFDSKRPVTLIDLRGFGLWGEWHQGFRYPTLSARHEALCRVIDLWCNAFPTHKLALSASYDPDAPENLRNGPTDHFDAAFTENYAEYLYYSAFDYALKIPQITWRRDGAGGAVHSKERKLLNEAHALGRGPFVAEFVGGYGDFKKGGQSAVEFAVNDALSLHPNYINVLGWVGADALAFIKDQPEPFHRALRTMGYRLVPTAIEYPKQARTGSREIIKMTWVNRGVGRVINAQTLQFRLIDNDGRTISLPIRETFPSKHWIDNKSNAWSATMDLADVKPGDYTLCFMLIDDPTQRHVKLPTKGDRGDAVYEIGAIQVER
jgi:hypothetical protein